MNTLRQHLPQPEYLPPPSEECVLFMAFIPREIMERYFERAMRTFLNHASVIIQEWPCYTVSNGDLGLLFKTSTMQSSSKLPIHLRLLLRLVSYYLRHSTEYYGSLTDTQ